MGVTDTSGDREVTGGSWSHPSTAQRGDARLAPAPKSRSRWDKVETHKIWMRGTSPAFAGVLLRFCVAPRLFHRPLTCGFATLNYSIHLLSPTSTASDNHSSGKTSLPKGISEQGQGSVRATGSTNSGFPSGNVLISIRTPGMDSHRITASINTHPLPRG